MKIKDLKKLKGTDFERSVWLEISKIPFGDISTYKKIALKLFKKNASRAVANACGRNPMMNIIPCHRVLRSDGFLGGYSGKGGIKMKKKLLENEGHKFDTKLKIIL